MDSSHPAEYRRVFPKAGWINSNNNSGCDYDDDGGDDGDDDDDVRTHVLKVPTVAPKESRKIKRKVVPCANGKNYGTNDAYAVNLPKRTSDVNPKKVCHSDEDIFEDQRKANSKVVGVSEAGRRMFVPTEVRVLNESYVTTAIATPRTDMLDSSIPASRTSHVKAALPLAGNSTVATSWKNFQQGNAFSHNIERESENFDCHSLITNGDLDRGSEKQDTKIRLNKALTRSSGLDKLREKIKQQQLACKEHGSSKITELSAPVEKDSLANTTTQGDVDMVPETDCPSAAVDSSDSVCRASQSWDYNNNGLISTYTSKRNITSQKNNHVVKTRKIAANASTPSYKGFSRLKERNTENANGTKGKVKRTDSKSANTTGKAVTRTKVKKAARTQETQEKSKPKAVRAICRTNEIDIITPSSWKKGHEVVLRILGSKPKVQLAKTRPTLEMVDLQTIPAKLPQTAREMIEDLQLGRQTDTCINGNHEYESNIFERPKTKEKEFDKPSPILSILKRKPKFTVLDSEKQPKVRHYDPEEVRKFIAKKKTERVQKARENQEALHNEFIKRQERLQEVYRKQKEATASILRKENIYPSKKPFKESVCFDMSMFDSEDFTAVSGKAQVSDNTEDSTEETEEGSTTSKTSASESMSDQLSQSNDAACNKCTCHFPRTHSLQNPAADRKSSDYFYHSLLSTNKPVNPLVPGPISRTQLVTRQWSADLNRLHDLRESAATLTHKIKEMCQTSNFPISSSNIIIPEEEPVFAGAKTDQSLPGVQNIQEKAAEVFDKKEKDAATCIQAVYRGYTVRKNLHWQRLTGQTDFSEKANRYLERNSVSSCDEAQTPPPRSKLKGKLCFENISASSDEMTTPPKTTDFPNPTSRFKNLHYDYTELLRGNEVEERIPENSQEVVDTSWLCKPVSSRYPWKKNDIPDKYSVVNIFTSKYRTCNKAETEDSAQQEAPSLENSQPKPLISSSLHLNTNDLNVPPPQHQHHRPTTELLENIYSGLPRLKAPTAFSMNPSAVSWDTFEMNNSCRPEVQDAMATASLGSLPSQKISLVGAESKEVRSDKLPDEIHTSSRIKSPYSINPVIQTNGNRYGLQDLHSSSSCGDSEAENQSTIEMSSQILSSVGDGTDSDISSLQNDLPSKSMCPYKSQFPAVGGYSAKEGDTLESSMKKYSPAQLPMKLRAELYNWEQTVESLSLAQQETFSLGRIFQTQSQNPELNLHYLEQMRRAMAMLDNNATSRVPPAEPVISSPEPSDHSGVLKSIMAEEKQPASQKSFSHYHSLNSTVTSKNTLVSKETSASDDQPASGTQFNHKAARHSSSIPSASISSHLSQKRHSHRASSQRSSSNFIKTLSDARNHSDSSSGTVTEDISASSGTEASSTSQPSEYLTKTSSSSKRRIVHNKENQPSKKLTMLLSKESSV
ncbi:centrosome-associated protein 350 isoform X2 [Octopus sinensis]|uniref:Centrosome-associated protein 350 isoform X2 n=1 Tax=Octopus sinensis TaxID=2607531 RepID=A0A7E6FKG8_9MOLL|nr:centrosome-associated protein 350 isoform X2 [Octopus sinensis]